MHSKIFHTQFQTKNCTKHRHDGQKRMSAMDFIFEYTLPDQYQIQLNKLSFD